MKECRNIPSESTTVLNAIPNSSNQVAAFCILQLEKQQVKTQTNKATPKQQEHSFEPWDEGFTLYVSNIPELPLTDMTAT